MGEKKAGRRACHIVSNCEIARHVYEMVLEYPQDFTLPVPGQFVNMYCRHQGRLLPRPVSVCEIDECRRLHLVYAVQGAGTLEFTTYMAGERVEILSPLGAGFSIDFPPGRALLVGGGVGTPPLVELAKRLKERKWQVETILGFRDEPFLHERLRGYGRVHVATDSGAAGFRGNVLELMESVNLSGDRLFACGPTPMLQGLQEFAGRYKIAAELSLEERMGCGFGGCVGCVVQIVADNEEGFIYKKVCKDGPVFAAEEVLFP